MNPQVQTVAELSKYELTIMKRNAEYEAKLVENFEDTFCASERILLDIIKLVEGMGVSKHDFVKSMKDGSFESNELAYWAQKHCKIRNRATNDFTVSYVDFEKILKALVFSDYDYLMRFLCYFLNEFFVFGTTSGECWMRAKVSKHNPESLKPRSINEFKNIKVSYKTDKGVAGGELFTVLKSLPFHKFSNICHIWNHAEDDLDTFSAALPFQYTDVGHVDESELPEVLLYYMREVLCNGDAESWIWLRSYLANIIHNPDERTRTMLILYSQEKQCGKSTLKHILDQILGETTNIGKAETLQDAFGDRGSTAFVGKRVVWFEELTEKKAVFRACMDRMKTAITDPRMTYKPLYQELKETNNTNEYIACTNHLVGVLEDRQTVLHVSNKHKKDEVFYANLRNTMNQRECNKFASYLKQYKTAMPMQIHKTEIYRSMLSNGAEPIEMFINALKANDIQFEFSKTSKYWYCSKELLYDATYLKWCESNGEKPTSFNHFKEKFGHYDRDCEYKRITVLDRRVLQFVVPVNWNESTA